MSGQSDINLFQFLNNVGKLVVYLNNVSHESGFIFAFNKTNLAKTLNIPRSAFFRAFDEAVAARLIIKINPTDEQVRKLFPPNIIISPEYIRRKYVWVKVVDLTDEIKHIHTCASILEKS